MHRRHISTRLLSDRMKVCPCIRAGLAPDRALGAKKSGPDLSGTTGVSEQSEPTRGHRTQVANARNQSIYYKSIITNQSITENLMIRGTGRRYCRALTAEEAG
jgi:hypothetical protein